MINLKIRLFHLQPTEEERVLYGEADAILLEATEILKDLTNYKGKFKTVTSIWLQLR